MSHPNDPIRLDSGDLHSESVESYLEVRRAMRQSLGERHAQPLVLRVIYASWFYLAIASGFGAFVAWLLLEPFIDDSDQGFSLITVVVFPAVTGGVGLFLGAAEGLMCRNPLRATISGLVGLGVGFAGGLILFLPTEILYSIMMGIAVNLNDPSAETLTGVAFLVLMMGRAAAWAFTAIPAGLGQGIALREGKVMLNGTIGGALGGLLGGLLFDPIALLFVTSDGQAAVSRAVGFVTIGLLVGLFVGLVEGWTKTAWLHMRAGPLAGKQFVLHRDTTILGSAPKADVYLFKDAAIDPRHAVIYNRGGRFEIEDCHTAEGTYVNQLPVRRQILKNGDQIVLGKTVLEFVIKETS